MKSKLTILVTLLMAMALLAGCKEDLTTLGSFFGSGGSSAGSGAVGGSAGAKGHVPEPATMALLGSGLLGYALFRRFRKK